MGNSFQFVQANKTAGTFYGMDGPENAGKDFCIAGVLLQFNEVFIKAIQILITLYQKLVDDRFHILVNFSRRLDRFRSRFFLFRFDSNFFLRFRNRGNCLGRSIIRLQPGQSFNQTGIIHTAFILIIFDAGKHLTNGIHHSQKSTGSGGTQFQFAIPQLPQQVFTNMRHRFQFVETDEATGAFYGMDGPENAGENVYVTRVLLQINQILVQLVQVFIAFDQELIDDFTHSVTLI